MHVIENVEKCYHLAILVWSNIIVFVLQVNLSWMEVTIVLCCMVDRIDKSDKK